MQATELLLQERVPREAAAAPPRPAEETRRALDAPMSRLRRFRSPHTFHPHAQFLSNGSYVTVLTNAGGGASRWRGLSITRWREDRTIRRRAAISSICATSAQACSGRRPTSRRRRNPTNSWSPSRTSARCSVAPTMASSPSSR